MKLYSILFLIILSCSSAFAKDISFEQIVEHVNNSHPIFKKAEINVNIAEVRSKEEKSVIDWNLSASTRFNRYQTIRTSFEEDETSKRNNDSDHKSVTIGLNKLLWDSGARFSFSLSAHNNNTKYHETSIQGEDLDYDYSSNNAIFSLGFKLPLLENAFGINTRYPYEQSLYAIEIEKLIGEDLKEDWIFELSKLFIEWKQHIEAKDLIENFLAKTEDLHLLLQQSNNKNLSLNLIRLRALQEIIKYDLVRESDRAIVQKNTLARLVGLNFDNNTNPKFDFHRQLALTNITENPNKIVTKSRPYLINNLSRQQIKLSRSKAKNKLKPNLNLETKLRRNNTWINESDDTRDNTEASISLSLNYPFGNTYAKNNLDRIDLSLLRNTENQKQIMLNFSSEWINSINRFDSLSKEIELLSNNTETINKKYQQEIELFTSHGFDFFDFSIILDTLEELYINQLDIHNRQRAQHLIRVEFINLTEMLYPVGYNEL